MPGASAMLSMRPLAALLALTFVLIGDRGAAEAVDLTFSLVTSSRPASPVAVIQHRSAGSRLLVSTDAGRSWRDATPRALPGHIYDVFFVDARRGWLVAFDCAVARGALFGTKDAGRTWTRLSRSPRAWYTNCAAGSGISLEFVDAVNGWAVEVIANAPSKELRQTRDGGRTWRLVAEDRLPSAGRVRFRTPEIGWQRAEVLGSPVSGGLFRTDDGGRTWAREPSLPTERGFSLPTTARGKPLVAAGRSGFVDIYERGSPGWRRISTVRVAHSAANLIVAAPTLRSRWLAVEGRRSLAALFLSEDGGRTWARRTIPPGAKEFAAASGTQAWVSRWRDFWATRDGGMTWRRVRVSLRATP
jgi:photosystem II stability/assembly factor-like uncharacterized protein